MGFFLIRLLSSTKPFKFVALFLFRTKKQNTTVPSFWSPCRIFLANESKQKVPQPPCFVISNSFLNLQPKISASLFCSCCVECFFYSTPKQNLVPHYTFFSFVCYNLISVSLRSRSLLHTTLCYHTLVTTPNPKQKNCLLRSLVRSNETKNSHLSCFSPRCCCPCVPTTQTRSCVPTTQTLSTPRSTYTFYPHNNVPCAPDLALRSCVFHLALYLFFFQTGFTKPSTLASTYLSTSRVVTLVPHKFSSINQFDAYVPFLLSVTKTYQNLPLLQKVPSCFVVANDHNKTPPIRLVSMSVGSDHALSSPTSFVSFFLGLLIFLIKRVESYLVTLQQPSSLMPYCVFHRFLNMIIPGSYFAQD